MTALNSVKVFGLALLIGTMAASLSVHAQQYNDGYMGNQGYGGYGEQVGMPGGGYGDSYRPNNYMQAAPPMQPYQQNYGPRPMPPQGYGPGYGRPPGHAYGGYGQNPCEQARREMRMAQMGLTISVNNLNNIGSRCGDNMVCIFGYQNVYNQAVINMQKAQQKVDRACSYGGRPRY